MNPAVRLVPRRVGVALVLLVGLVLARPASARPQCERLTESEFRTLVLDAQAAIDRDDAVLHEQIVGEVLARVPCVDFVPSPRLWADFLVGLAIVEFSRDGDWQTPMGAALRIRPSVDRGVGGGHPIAVWEPPEAQAASPGKVRDGVHFFVDGVATDKLPPSEGMFLVQREDDGNHATLFLVDQEVPPTWLTARIEPPIAWVWRADLVGGASAAMIRQKTLYTTDWIPDDRWLGPVVHGTARGAVHHGLFGGLADLTLGWSPLGSGSGGTGSGYVGLFWRGLVVGVGGGLSGIDAFEESETFDGALVKQVNLPHASAMVSLRRERRRVMELALTGAAGPAISRAGLGLALEGGDDAVRWRMGFTAAGHWGAFTQVVDEDVARDRLAIASFVRTGLEVGVTTGGKR